VTDLDLGTLFEHWDRYSTYASLDDELRAVAAGSKAMSYFAFPHEDIETSELSLEVRRIASELNLATIRRKGLAPELEGRIPHTYLFVIRGDEQAWRIPAFLFAMKVALRSGWSDAVDDLLAYLLGYSDAEIQRWNADRKRFHVNEEGLTVLFLMSAAQAANVRTLGRRAIDPRAIRPPVTVFYNLHGKVVRKDASTLIPANHELLRASLDQAFAKAIFPDALIEDPAIEVATCTIDETEGTALNSALRSNFQFLGADGWH
jgi:hypothetical protein